MRAPKRSGANAGSRRRRRPAKAPRNPPAETGDRRLAPPATRAWLITAVEAFALAGAALLAVLAMLGRLAAWFTGNGLWAHVLPFAGAVLGLGLVLAGVLWVWFRVRHWLARRLVTLPAILALAIAATAAWVARQPLFWQDVGNLRTLVGGPAEAERVAIAHQVYAAYRRADRSDLQRLLERARVYEATVQEAATAFAVDAEVLMGVGATESAFYPRDSRDGGRGLFQITAPPAAALEGARTRLGVKGLDPLNQRHNAFVAAATLQHYLGEMRGDLFLGLLAYNIGPRNGGLRSIMTQYGARDFVAIQPYLQNLPRDYPIRVLSAALAYRLWRTLGRLPRYDEGANAQAVQAVGIPGLQPGPLPMLQSNPRP